jgi:hypothetical protein
MKLFLTGLLAAAFLTLLSGCVTETQSHGKWVERRVTRPPPDH